MKKPPHAPTPVPTATRSGFTLVESLLVLVIIGILVTLAIGSLGFRGVLSRARETATLASITTEARQLAVDNGHDVILTVDTTGSVKVHEDRNNNGREDPGERIQLFRLSDPPPRLGADTTGVRVFVHSPDSTGG